MRHSVMEEVTTDARLRVWLASPRRQQHLLVQCPRRRIETVAAQVMNFAAGPVRRCPLPGALQFGNEQTRTLLLCDVAALKLNQQVALFDFLGACRRDIRVVALTSEPIDRLVESGDFLEGLLHRLGAVLLHIVSERSREASASRTSDARTPFERAPIAEKAGVC